MRVRLPRSYEELNERAAVELAEGTTPRGCPVDQEDVSPTVGSNPAGPMKTKNEYGFEDKWSSRCPVKAERVGSIPIEAARRKINGSVV